MDVLTPEEIRERTPRIEWMEMGYGAPSGSDPDPLVPVIIEARIELERATSVKVADIDEVEQEALAVLTNKALRLMVAYNASGETQELLDTATDYDVLSSFSRGGVSESRRQLGAGRGLLHQWSVVDRLLRTIEGIWLGEIDPGIPEFGAPDPLDPKPGAEIMDRRDAGSIFGELAPGVHRPPSFYRNR